MHEHHHWTKGTRCKQPWQDITVQSVCAATKDCKGAPWTWWLAHIPGCHHWRATFPWRSCQMVQCPHLIGILMPNELTHNRAIVLQCRDRKLQHVSELHRSYDVLQYPLLFLHVTDGYHIYLQRRNGKVTQIAYYAFYIMVRNTNHLLRAHRLFQQFLVDAYCKIETERLMLIWRAQKKLCADSYHALLDSL